MRRCVLPILALLILCLPARAQTRMVFAHFHLPYGPHGHSVEGYLQDIRDARAAGLDGFVLNFGGWNSENGQYRNKVRMMFEAAVRSGAGFKLLVSPDLAGSFTDDELREIVRTYHAHPNYFRHDGRPVLSTWSGEGGGRDKSLPRWKGVLEPLRAEGIDVLFVPMFYAVIDGRYYETPGYEQVLAAYRDWWHEVIDGAYYFAGTGLPHYTPDGTPSVLEAGEAFARVMRENGKRFMAGVSPQYWGVTQTPGRRYFEFSGGEGLHNQWRSIIEKQKPDWVELFTWNDFTEATYFSPVDDPAWGNWPLRTWYGMDYFPTHKGLTELNRYFVRWYKTGKQPPIAEDALFYAYRTHPADAAAGADPRGPVPSRIGTVRDEIVVTTLLQKPAELRVVLAGKTRAFPVGAGIVHTRVPFVPGTPAFELYRGGKRLLRRAGEPILATPLRYNFSYTTGYAASRPRPDLVVTGTRVVAHAGGPVLEAVVRNRGTAPVPAGARLGVAFSLADGTTLDAAPLRGPLAPGASVAARTLPGAWKPAPGGAHEIVTRVDDGGAVAEEDEYNNRDRVVVTVGPALHVRYAAQYRDIPLAEQGTRDWALWGAGPGGATLRHSGGTETIGEPIALGGAAVQPLSDSAAGFAAEGAVYRTGIRVSGEGAGFRLSVPADTTPRTLRLYLGGERSAGRLSAWLSDSSAPRYGESYDIFVNQKGGYYAVYILTYRAAAPGQRLEIEWKRNAGDGSIHLSGASLGDGG